MGSIFFAAYRRKIEANSTFIDTLERGIKKGGCFVEQSPFWGCFYEAKTRKFIACEVRKPLILLHFSKSSVSPLAPNQYNPNQVFPVGDGFGFIVFFNKFEDTHFRNGVIKRPESKPRGPRKKKPI